MQKVESFNPKTGKVETLNLINPDAPKSIFDPNSEFIKELELYKLRSEIKPRKVNMMQSQIGMIADIIAPVRVTKQLYVPFDGKGNKAGFVK